MNYTPHLKWWYSFSEEERLLWVRNHNKSVTKASEMINGYLMTDEQIKAIWEKETQQHDLDKDGNRIPTLEDYGVFDNPTVESLEDKWLKRFSTIKENYSEEVDKLSITDGEIRLQEQMIQMTAEFIRDLRSEKEIMQPIIDGYRELLEVVKTWECGAKMNGVDKYFTNTLIATKEAITKSENLLKDL